MSLITLLKIQTELLKNILIIMQVYDLISNKAKNYSFYFSKLPFKKSNIL